MRRRKRRQRVVAVFASVPPGTRLHGLQIMQAAQIGAGTLYPTLAELEWAGTLRSEWSVVRSSAGLRRRLYWMDDDHRVVNGLGDLVAPERPVQPS